MTTTNQQLVDVESLKERLERGFTPVSRSGYVTAVTGTIVRAAIPDVRVGELCRIERGAEPPLDAEVIGFDRQDILLVPLGRIDSIPYKARVEPVGSAPTVPCGALVCGRVLDAVGHPLDNGPGLANAERTPLMAPPPHALNRIPINQPLSTGVRPIDGLLTIGRGQRVGIFAGAGVGKSTLLSAIARNADADTIVLALIGERGREVRGFIEDDLKKEGMAKSTVVVSTSDQPALLRLRAAYTATAIAESARAKGHRVVLMMDSVTRFARALRDVGLAAGEPPGRQGFPASVFATLPLLFERAGNDEYGSITAFYTVLVTGDDMSEPVADETKSLLDGHIVLSRKLAQRQHYPAIDISQSVSRVMNAVITPRHRKLAEYLKEIISVYEQNEDKITLGLYVEGTDERIDRARNRIKDVQAFLTRRGSVNLAASLSEMETLCGKDLA
ncbi:MAG: FliI/YscN family ATPase [Tepidisphaeraceae bacterium]|jgi:FliI/YscN family ATPase